MFFIEYFAQNAGHMTSVAIVIIGGFVVQLNFSIIFSERNDINARFNNFFRIFMLGVHSRVKNGDRRLCLFQSFQRKGDGVRNILLGEPA